MKFLLNIGPEWPVRIGTGIMYLYSGFDLMMHPGSWHWALPYWLKQLITALVPLDLYIKLQGGLEVILAFVLLAWFLPRRIVIWAALLSALEMAGILVLAFLPWSATNFTTTFRDIGLLGGSLSLLIMLARNSEATRENATIDTSAMNHP